MNQGNSSDSKPPSTSQALIATEQLDQILKKSHEQLRNSVLKAQKSLEESEKISRNISDKQQKRDRFIYGVFLIGITIIIVEAGALMIATTSLFFDLWKRPSFPENPPRKNVCNCQNQTEIAVAIKSLEKKIEELKFAADIKKDLANINHEQKANSYIIQNLEKELEKLKSFMETERVIRSIINEQLQKDLAQEKEIGKALESLSKSIDESLN